MTSAYLSILGSTLGDIHSINEFVIAFSLCHWHNKINEFGKNQTNYVRNFVLLIQLCRDRGVRVVGEWLVYSTTQLDLERVFLI